MYKKKHSMRKKHHYLNRVCKRLRHLQFNNEDQQVPITDHFKQQTIIFIYTFQSLSLTIHFI